MKTYIITKQSKKYSEFDYSLNIEDVVNYLKSKEDFAFDTETTGTNARKHSIILEQYGDKEYQFVIDCKTIPLKSRKSLHNLLEEGKYTKLTFHGSFDYIMCMANYNIYLNNYRDLLLEDIVTYNGIMNNIELNSYKNLHGFWRYSMPGLCKKYLGKNIQKTEREGFINHKGQFTRDQLKYAANDILYTSAIAPIIKANLEKYKLLIVAALENYAAPAFAEMEFNGIKLNKDMWLELYNKNLEREKQMELKLDDLIVKEANKYPELNSFLLVGENGKGLQSDMFIETDNLRKTSINFNSSKDKVKILEAIGIDTWTYDRVDGTHKQTSGKEHIKNFKNDYPVVKELLEWSKINQLRKTYGIKFLRHIDKDTNRIHTSFDQIKETGRCSTRVPNLQNQPSLQKYRSCYRAEKGNKIITADYSNMELRLIADKSKDKTLLEAFKKGEDVHSKIAMKIYKAAYGKDIEVSKQVNSDIRSKFKTVTFALAFGASAFNLTMQLGIDIKEAEETLEMYFTAFPNLRKYFKYTGDFAVRNGYIRTYPPYSRIRWFPEHADYKELYTNTKRDKSEFKRMKKIEGNIRRAGMNTPIQGSAADIVKRALGMCIRRYREFNQERDLLKRTPNFPFGSPERARLILQVHDELNTEVGKEYAEEVATDKVFLMEMAGNGVVEHVIMKADYTIKDYWSKD